MKKIQLLGLTILLFLFSAASEFNVQSNWVRPYDFSKLKSYVWAPIPQPETGDIRLDDPGFDAVIRDTVDQVLAQKGYEKKTEGSPDFWVNYYASIKGKVETSTTKMPYYANVTPRGMFGSDSWSAGGDLYRAEMESITVSEYYEEGTLILDVADPSTKKLIWRGVVTGVVKPDISDDKRKKRIGEAVDQLLKQFPPPAK